MLRLSGGEEKIINAKECYTVSFSIFILLINKCNLCSACHLMLALIVPLEILYPKFCFLQGSDESRWSETLNFTGSCESLIVVVSTLTAHYLKIKSSPFSCQCKSLKHETAMFLETQIWISGGARLWHKSPSVLCWGLLQHERFSILNQQKLHPSEIFPTYLWCTNASLKISSFFFVKDSSSNRSYYTSLWIGICYALAVMVLLAACVSALCKWCPALSSRHADKINGMIHFLGHI